MHDGIEMIHISDLPAGSGLGSSSAFTVGMLHALRALRGESIVPVQLASNAITVEQEVLKETVGVQDQIACTYGGLNQITIARDGDYSVRGIPPHNPNVRQLASRLMMFFTGRQRHASEIAKAQIDNTGRNEKALHEIMGMVPQAIEILEKGDLDDFGHLLNEAWILKRGLSDKITTPVIDDIYHRARNAGALGGKVLGAGGGGFMLFYVPVKYQAAVRTAMGDMFEVRVQLESRGSKLVYFAS